MDADHALIGDLVVANHILFDQIVPKPVPKEVNLKTSYCLLPPQTPFLISDSNPDL